MSKWPDSDYTDVMKGLASRLPLELAAVLCLSGGLRAAAAPSAMDFDRGAPAPRNLLKTMRAEAATGGGAPYDVDIFRRISYSEIAPDPSPIADPDERGAAAPQPALYSINLASTRNAYLKSSLTFTTGKGGKVYLSAARASNCPDGGDACASKDKILLTLWTDKGVFFVRAMEILNWFIFYSGSRTVAIDGENYVLKIHANPSSPESSIIEVKGPSGVVLNPTVRQLEDAATSRDADVQLTKTYRLAYVNEVVQGPGGTKFTAKMLVRLVVFPMADLSVYEAISADDIKPEGTRFLGYDFRLNNGTLEIYKP